MTAPAAPIPAQCRYAQAVAKNHGYDFEILDGGIGYLFRISRGEKSFLAGAGPLSSYPLNNANSASIARDKIFTNAVLSRNGIANLGGRCFFLSSDGRALRGDGYELDDARLYAKQIGYPLFCKPLTGSRGDFAERIADADEFEDYVRRTGARHQAIVIQQFFSGSEFRVFVFDGEPIFCLEKSDVVLSADGSQTAAGLLSALNAGLAAKGISPYPPTTKLTCPDGRSVDPDSVPPSGAKVIVCGRKNIIIGLVPRQVEPIPADLLQLAQASASALNLRAAAVDLLKESGGSLRVIEVNANPEISSLEALDRWDLIEKIWLSTIEALLK